MQRPIKLGISSCLTGGMVRYDGGHKLDPFLVNTVGRYVQYAPVCPEAECGFGIPRDPMRLEGNPENPRLVKITSGQDLTETMTAWAKHRVTELEKEDLYGFVFKKNSPCCGMERVNVYTESGTVKKGKGIFSRIYQEHFPLHPVEDEAGIHDPVLREHFVERIFVFGRWREFLAANRSRGGLVGFHSCHKLQILAHSTEYYRKMGKLVADLKTHPEKDLYAAYQTLLSEAFSLKATPKKHVNALQHAAGYFKKQLTSDEKQELNETMDQYRNGIVPILVPVTLLNHYIRKYDQPYLKSQHYLSPHPAELQLRNHA